MINEILFKIQLADQLLPRSLTIVLQILSNYKRISSKNLKPTQERQKNSTQHISYM